MMAKLQFSVAPGSGSHAFGAIFQGSWVLRDVVISGNSDAGQEEAFNPKVTLSIAKELCRSVLQSQDIYPWAFIGKERLWKAL